MAVFLFIFFVLLLVRIDRYFFKRNHSFCLRYIHSTIANKADWQLPDNPEIKEIINQKFRYFNKGKQSFVFLSEDGQYVLKFYRFHSSFRPLPWLNHPFTFLFHPRKKRAVSLAHLTETFRSFKAAYLDLKEETAVVFVHLNPDGGEEKIRIIDTFGIEHCLCRNKLSFILQKRGELLYPYLSQLIQNLEFDRAKQLINGVLDLFLSCAEKGYTDDDCILDKNYGVLENRAMILDVGKLRFVGKIENKKNYLIEKTQSLRNKLEKESPELLTYYSQKISTLFD